MSITHTLGMLAACLLLLTLTPVANAFARSATRFDEDVKDAPKEDACPVDKNHFIYDDTVEDGVKEIITQFFGDRIPTADNICGETYTTAVWLTPYDICILSNNPNRTNDFDNEVVEYCKNKAVTYAFGALAGSWFGATFDINAAEKEFHFKMCLDSTDITILWENGHCHDRNGLPWYSQMREELLYCAADTPATCESSELPITQSVKKLDQAEKIDFDYEEFFKMSTDSSPLGAAFCGGGWRALSTHMGVMRALSDTEVLKNIKYMSSNSGGTWFLGMMSYSEKFSNAVLGKGTTANKDIYNVTQDFMQAYADGFETLYKDILAENEASLGGLKGAIKYIAGLLMGIELSWQNFIGKMIEGYDGNLKDASAGKPTTADFMKKKIGFTLGVPGQTFINSGPKQSDRDQAVLTGVSAEKNNADMTPQGALPLYYEVGEEGGKMNILSLSEGEVDDAANGASGSVNMLQKKSIVDNNKGWFSTKKSKSKDWSVHVSAAFENELSVAAVLGASSAAVGMLGSKPMMQAMLSFNCIPGAVSIMIMMIYPLLNIESLGICSNGEIPEKGGSWTCPFPATRLVDGGPAGDNMGMIASLVRMQNDHPKLMQNDEPDLPPFRLFASFSNSCAEGVDYRKCAKDGNGIEKYFAFNSQDETAPSGYTYPSEPGAVKTSPYYGFETYSTQIFKETMPLEWDNNNFEGYGRIRTLSVKVTTVENEIYGVKAGTKVHLFVVYANADGAKTPVFTFPVMDKEKENYGDLAQSLNGFLATLSESK